MVWSTIVRGRTSWHGYHHGRPPRNKGLQYPADSPTVEEIVAVMRAAGDHADGVRLRGLIIVLWRVGLQISEGAHVRAPQRRRPWRRRFDSMWTTPEFGLQMFSTHYQAALDAGTDHALLHADLELAA